MKWICHPIRHLAVWCRWCVDTCFIFFGQNLKGRLKKNLRQNWWKKKTLLERERWRLKSVATLKWERCPKNVSLSLIFFLNNCILISPHVYDGGYIFISLVVVVVVIFCSIFEMSRHFDGTSFSLLYKDTHTRTFTCQASQKLAHITSV